MPAIPEDHRARLAETLGPLVALANPLDYHTFIWGDEAKMTDTFAAMMGDWVDLSVLVIDFPRDDRCSDAAWHPAVAAMKRAGEISGTRVAMLGSLTEGLSEDWAITLLDQGILPLCGFEHGLRAIELAAQPVRTGSWQPHPAISSPASSSPAISLPANRQLVDEAAAKAILTKAGVAVPRGITAAAPSDLEAAAAELTAPLVLKGLGHAHKSEAGLIRLGLAHDALAEAAAAMTAAQGFLVEEMAPPPAAELLVGLRRDPVYGISLTVGIGGVEAELLGDVATLILPAGEAEIRDALSGLRMAPLLTGYRGRPAADIDAAVATIQKLCTVIETSPDIDEIEINPLMLARTSGSDLASGSDPASGSDLASGKATAGSGALALDAVIWNTAPTPQQEDAS